MSDSLSLLRQAYIEIKGLRSQLAHFKALSEPIAVIGFGCRFPGGASDAASFWQVLEQGVDAVREVSPQRWAVPARDDRGVRWAGFLDDSSVQEFDAEFFGVSPREATSMDPQQRLLLEVAWEALEDAGQLPERLVGSKTGVFVGMCFQDYAHRTCQSQAGEPDAYYTTGNFGSIAAGRVSFVLGLQGPSMTIDTACSSSLVSVHQAMASLHLGECDMALAGGVNLILSPDSMEAMARLQALSPDGRCKTFDALANGYVRGEGCGLLVLKRLSDAQRDHDRIWALLRGSAINQDGRSTGLTTPNVLSQQALLRAALDSAQVPPDAIGYVEAHGTGTPLGDPIEMQALTAILGERRSDGSDCYVASVKTNIGHLEGAAGVAGLVKGILVLQREVIPRHLNLSALNPRIRLQGTAVKIPVESQPWPRGPKPRLLGVSSFGISGTNAHVIMQEAPLAADTQAALSGPLLLPLSARKSAALKAAARAWAAKLREPGAPLADLLYTAAVLRTHHHHRLAVVGDSSEVLATALQAFSEGQSPVNLTCMERTSEARPRVVFVFPGHGSQWVGMGRDLLAREPVFRSSLEASDAAIRAETGWSVVAELQADASASRLDQVDVIQPILFAVAVALAAQWRFWGIEPDAVIGHSMGEVAAVHVAGGLSLADAARIICSRSRLLRRVRGQGAMATVELSMEEAEARLAGLEEHLCVALSNAPRSTVISGSPGVLDDLLATLSEEGVFCRRVKTDVAFHSPQMDPLREELVAALVQVRPHPTQTPVVSTVTGTFVDGESFDATYWGKNLREPVRFAVGVQHLVEAGYSLFVELSPHPILLPAVQSMIPPQALNIPSLRRERAEQMTMLEGLGALYAAGCNINWKHLYPQGGVASTPNYPWQRRRFWLEVSSRNSAAGPAVLSGGHPLTGHSIPVAGHKGWRLWHHTLGLEALPFLSDHCIGDGVVFPGTGYVEMALAAARDILGDSMVELEQIDFRAPLLFSPDKTESIQVLCTESESGTTFQISSLQENGSWMVHAAGTFHASTERHVADSTVPSLQPAVDVPVEPFYSRLASKDLRYGPAFRGVVRLWAEAGHALGEVHLLESVSYPEQYCLHPAQLDAAFHVLLAALPGAVENGPVVPISARCVRWAQRPTRHVWSHAEGRLHPDGSIEGDVRLMDDKGRVQAEILGLRMQPLVQTSQFRDWFLTLRWEREDLAQPPRFSAPGTWLVLCDTVGVGNVLAGALETMGELVVRVVASAMDLADPRGWDPILEAVARTRRPCRGILHLWSLDVPVEVDPDTLPATQVLCCGSVIHLVQSLSRTGWRDVPRLWMVTQETQAIAGFPSAIPVSQCPLWGLRRTLAIEHAELRPTMLDLPGEAISEAAHWLLSEVQHGSREEEIAYRPDGRYVARIVRQEPRVLAPSVLHSDATYVVTGGTGGLGLVLANWLVAKGARNLALLSRHGMETLETRRSVGALEAAGARVEVHVADVSNRAQLTAVLTSIRASMPPLRGVVHTAGVLGDATVLQQTLERLHTVMAPKAVGAWNLHDLTLEDSLDFFVLYSSVAALLGSPGQSNYSAANGFLDGLARARHAQGRPALSVQWGPFSQVGMAAQQSYRGERLGQRGLDSLTPEAGLDILGRLLSIDAAEMGVAAFNLRHWVDFYPQMAGSPLLQHLQTETVSRGGEVAPILQMLAETRAEDRPARLEHLVREQVAQILRMDVDAVEPRMPFINLGMDSLMGLELRNRLEVGLGLKLPATLIFTQPTVAQMAVSLLARVSEAAPKGASPSHVTPVVTAATPVDSELALMSMQQMQGLSEDEADELLRQTLSELKEFTT